MAANWLSRKLPLARMPSKSTARILTAHSAMQIALSLLALHGIRITNIKGSYVLLSKATHLIGILDFCQVTALNENYCTRHQQQSQNVCSHIVGFGIIVCVSVVAPVIVKFTQKMLVA